jgi:D-alanyl-D-alanine carboxypeptidase
MRIYMSKNRLLTGMLTVIMILWAPINAFAYQGQGLVSYTETTTTSQASSDPWPEAPSISAESAILMDADSGAVLYEKDAHAKAYPASTTKIMTALLAIENCSLEDTITFSRAAANSYKWDEANTGTKEGEEFTVEQALYAILLKSANEVAYGLGEYISGSIPDFASLMNERAKELGALNTHFNNANGLSDPDHYTTAYDLAMIGRACFDNTTFMNICSYSDTYRIPATNKTSTERTFTQRHGMAKNNGYAYEYFKGGKTGFTDESGYTLITFVQKDDMRLICVVFKENDDASRYVDTKALCDYGFNNFKKSAVSSDNISSLFNSSSYYNSGVFGSSTLNFTMNSSYIDLPNDVTLDQVTTTVTPDDTPDGADFSATVSFQLEGHDLGQTKVLVNVDKSQLASNLPAASTMYTTDYTPKKAIVVNIWLVIIVLVAVGIIIEMLEIRKQNQGLRRRRQQARRRKLK